MRIRVNGVDFPPTRSLRTLATEQLSRVLRDVAEYVDKVEVYLVEFSASASRTESLCSAVIFFGRRSPMLVEASAPRLTTAITHCVAKVASEVEQNFGPSGPGPSSLRTLFE